MLANVTGGDKWSQVRWNTTVHTTQAHTQVHSHLNLYIHTLTHTFTHMYSALVWLALESRVKSLAIKLKAVKTSRTDTHPLHGDAREFLRYLLRLLLLWSLCFNPPSSAVISNRSQAPPSPWQHRPRNHGPTQEDPGISSLCGTHAPTLQNYKRIWCRSALWIKLSPTRKEDKAELRFSGRQQQGRAGSAKQSKAQPSVLMHEHGSSAL